MSKFEIITRHNKQRNADETYVRTEAKILSIETDSRLTKENKKPYGFFNAQIAGKLASGIAYQATVGDRNIKTGDMVPVEALKADLLEGHNNRWRIALLSAESLSDEITKFLSNV
jgi:hypothetical protein